MNIPILYEDDYILAVNKPAGIQIHFNKLSKGEPFLLQFLEEQTGSTLTAIHRLDRATEGIVLFAKQKEKSEAFYNLFRERKIEKKYLCLVNGNIPGEGEIEIKINANKNQEKQEALTLFERLKSFETTKPADDIYNEHFDKDFFPKKCSLLSVQPLTGRKHQIRIHLQKLGFSIIGDKRYGYKRCNLFYRIFFKSSGMFLQAKSLKFIHPFHEKETLIEAEESKIFKNAMNLLNTPE